jgi:hypothetical protein
MKKEIVGNNSSGKGSKRRKENFKQFVSNWDLISWNKVKNKEKNKKELQ